MADACLVDTNVLLRFVKPDDCDYALVSSVLARLWTANVDLCYTSQNLVVGQFESVKAKISSTLHGRAAIPAFIAGVILSV